jgi:S-adenosylmethionine hydrolase
MALRYDTISFLSDYGHDDEFVGVVKSVIRAIAPEVAVIDVSHEVPAHDVRAGGLALARSAQYLCPGVVLAVVDPGVGGPRRSVAVEVGDGASVLVGPDNGLLAPAVALVGGASRAVELTEVAFQLEAPGATFAGRDVFAPAAAHLCRGVDLLDLGPAIDPAGLLPSVLPISHLDDTGAMVAEVLWVDRFGNAQLNVDPVDVEPFGDRVRLRLGDDTRVAKVVRSYDEIGPGEIGLVVDSYGVLSIAAGQRSASDQLGLRAGSAVLLDGLDDETPDAVVERTVTRVQIGLPSPGGRA